MTWQEAVATLVVLAGLGAGAFLVAQRPAFWVEFGGRVLAALAPRIAAFISKRMTPEQEAEFQKSVRQGQEWDSFRKKPRDR